MFVFRRLHDGARTNQKFAEGCHVTARSNAVMGTHCMVFLTIGNLGSPSSPLYGNPLYDFPGHW